MKAKTRGWWGPQPDGSLFCSAKLNIWNPLTQAINWIYAKLLPRRKAVSCFPKPWSRSVHWQQAGVFLRGINNTKCWKPLGWYTVLASLTMLLLHPQEHKMEQSTIQQQKCHTDILQTENTLCHSFWLWMGKHSFYKHESQPFFSPFPSFLIQL